MAATDKTPFQQAFAAFIVAYERNRQLQDRCIAGESVDSAESVYLDYLRIQASEDLYRVSAETGGLRP
jgi:hypothetical protein